jgi:hypothetical protein
MIFTIRTRFIVQGWIAPKGNTAATALGAKIIKIHETKSAARNVAAEGFL